MGIEIERKYLVRGEFRRGVPTRMVQGYVCREEGRTIRIRIAGEEAWLTIKGPTENCTRPEYEYPIPVEDARELLQLSCTPLVEKDRWQIEHEGHLWEVDVFLGDNAGLIVAEIELSAPDEHFTRPDWLGVEVTEDPRYRNSELAINPFSRWTSAITANSCPPPD